ncbi:MAG TPA: M1 family metallopeptidase [Polyangiaceae bacterium]
MGARAKWTLVASAVAMAGCGATTPTPTSTSTATTTSTATATPTAIATPIPEDPVPTLRLPGDVHPLAEAIDLQLNPADTKYGGSVDIDVKLDAPRSTVWLHGKDFTVTKATLTPEGAAPIEAKWAERHETGVASISLASPAPVGKARIHIEYTAPFGRGQHGLYRATEDKADYVFTQFEAIAARQAFPCFDEPSFKIPYTVSLVVPDSMVAVANTHEISHAALSSGWKRVDFDATQPLPSYLVAFAVGPFDVVSGEDVPADGVRTRRLPLRAITPKGRGRDVGYALAHTGEFVTLLEKYTGIEYPWDKLDIVAVPGKGGAMENAGLVTFGEQLLLMDPATAPVSQRRGYASVMAHELAHQWTGDLVTMAWWDDTWLNEAFATWLAAKIVEEWDPKMHAALSLLRGGLRAMSVDALASARAIRQPITSTHDIENAFDTITYQKGGAVLDMFERWVGADAWQKGLHAHLVAHRFGNATADDFLQAENDASGRDVKSAFHTFLDQPGVPLVSAPGEECASWNPKRGVPLHQSRFVPLGSKVDPGTTWQIPVCVRAGADVRCELLTDRDGFLAFPRESGCAPYVFPNVDGAGYYRFALGANDLQALRARGLPKLSDREKLVFGASMRAAWSSGTTPMKDVMLAVEPLARDPLPAVAEEPMGYVSTARDWLWNDPLRARVERYGRGLYAGTGARLGWEAKNGEDDETRLLRGSALTFLALTAQDPAVRAEAKRRGLAYVKDGAVHPEAVDPNLAGMALVVVGEEADRATWDALRALLGKTQDEAVRGRLVRALSAARDPALAAAARDMMLDPSLRDTEVLTPLYVQLDRPDTRELAWAWMKEHYDALLARMPRHHSGVQLVGAGGRFCDADHAKDVESFFTPKIEGIEGGPRALAETLEDIHLCTARRTASEASARSFFAGR